MGKPYTIKFGSWSPDLQNVGVEMPFQWSETELPSADTLNVFYQDAAYRCLPGPSPFASSLGTPVLDAFTWYDNTAGKEIVFLATANGFFILEDGAYTAVPTQVSEGALGLAISIALGSPAGVAVWLSPSSESGISEGLDYTFPAVTANWGNGNPTAFNWYYTGAAGTWSIGSGQGTSSVIPQVTTGGPGTYNATLNCDITFSGGNTYTCSSDMSFQSDVSPTQHTYTSGSGTETVPYTGTLILEVWAPGGGGASGTSIVESGRPVEFYGGGAGAGGYARSSYAVTAGQTLDWAIEAPGAGGASGVSYRAGANGGTSTVSSGTLSITTVMATGGGGAPGAGGGSGGSATGGNQANTTGNSGTGGSPTGATGTNGVYAGPAGAGGGGGLGISGSGVEGSNGLISFYYEY